MKKEHDKMATMRARRVMEVVVLDNGAVTVGYQEVVKVVDFPSIRDELNDKGKVISVAEEGEHYLKLERKEGFETVHKAAEAIARIHRIALSTTCRVITMAEVAKEEGQSAGELRRYGR